MFRSIRCQGLVFASLISFFTAGPLSASAASFTILDFGAAGGSFIDARGISSDGQTIVGEVAFSAGQRGFVYDVATGSGSLVPLLPGGGNENIARNTSADGRFVVGRSQSANTGTLANDGEAYVFDRKTNTLLGLGDLPGGAFQSRATDISADGRFIVGDSEGNDGDASPRSDPFVYDRNTDIMTNLRSRVSFGGNRSLSGGAAAISADGSTVVGGRVVSFAESEGYFLRLADDTAVPFVDETNSFGQNNSPVDVSGDGRYVVGTSNVESVLRAYRYDTQNEAYLDLGLTSSGGFMSNANGLSGDGSVVVGLGPVSDLNASSTAMVWTEADGLQTLEQFADNLGFGDVFGGFDARQIRDVSADGQVLIGTGQDENGDRQSFVFIIPEPGMAAMLSGGMLALMHRRRGQSQCRAIGYAF